MAQAPEAVFENVIARRPKWVQRQIKADEARFLFNAVRHSGAVRAIEIGVASGFSSAIIYSALRTNSWWPRLDAVDLSRRCYFDKSRKTGDAFTEIVGKKLGYALTLGAVSADLPFWGRRAEFAFIDGAHESPWPTLDVIAVSRFLSPGASIALHDIGERFTKRWNKFGARQLFDAWGGSRTYEETTPNIGIVQFESIGSTLESAAAALSQDWEENTKAPVLKKYIKIVHRLSTHNPVAARKLEDVMSLRPS